MKITKRIKHSREASKEVKKYSDSITKKFKNNGALTMTEKSFLVILLDILNNKVDTDLWGTGYGMKDIDIEELKKLCKTYHVTSNIFNGEGLFSLTLDNITKYNESNEKVKVLNKEKRDL